jgi:hypothetical protein
MTAITVPSNGTYSLNCTSSAFSWSPDDMTGKRRKMK